VIVSVKLDGTVSILWKRGNGRTAAEREHKNRKLPADTFKNQPVLDFFYSPLP
jgi:hypothetical protein